MPLAERIGSRHAIRRCSALSETPAYDPVPPFPNALERRAAHACPSAGFVACPRGEWRALNDRAAVSLPSPSTREGDLLLLDQAVGLLRPMIEAIIGSQEASFDRALHVVVLDPRVPPGTAFDEAILGAYDFGASGRVDVDYGMYARAKARCSYEGKADTSVLRDARVGIDDADSLPLVGGVHVHGWTLGVSGAQPWIDEGIGHMLADLLRTLELQRAFTD
jgi:hypothetical protein